MGIFGSPPWTQADPEPAADEAAPPPAPLPELTAEEIKNGWNPKALAEYHAEAERRESERIAGSMEAKLHGRVNPPESQRDKFT